MVGVEDGSSDQKALEALLHNLPLPSAVQAKTSTPSPSPAATPPGTPSSQKKTPGKGKLLSRISILSAYMFLPFMHNRIEYANCISQARLFLTQGSTFPGPQGHMPLDFAVGP